MENNLNLETVTSMMGRMNAFMARSSTDSTQLGIAKEVFRWSAILTGSAAVVVAGLQGT